MAEQICVIGTVFLMMIVDFKKMACEFKKFFGLDSTQKFPALNIAENKLYMSDECFEFNVIEDSEWNYTDSVQAYYKHSKNCHEIGIKESVYQEARSGNKNALISIAHEISHWGLINHFKIDLGIKEVEELDDFFKNIIFNIHENITDLLTALLVFSEEELSKAECAKELDFSSCMSKDQISLAHFYCQNHKVLTENFIKNFFPEISADKGGTQRMECLSEPEDCHSELVSESHVKRC